MLPSFPTIPSFLQKERKENLSNKQPIKQNILTDNHSHLERMNYSKIRSIHRHSSTSKTENENENFHSENSEMKMHQNVKCHRIIQNVKCCSCKLYTFRRKKYNFILKHIITHNILLLVR